MIVDGDFVHVMFTAMATIFAVPAAMALGLLVIGAVVDVTVALVSSLRR
jgi:hypothetical protein